MKGGARPGAGRKGYGDEKKRFEVLTKSWFIVSDWLDDESTPLKERRAVALELVKKSVPQNIDVKSGGKPMPIIQLNVCTNDSDQPNNSTQEED